MKPGAGAIAGGSPEPLGVTVQGGGVNVAVFSAHAEAVELCLFDEAGEREVRRVVLPERTGDVHHGWIEGVGAGARYGLRAHGPHAPGQGHRFDPSRLLVDPYALALDRPFAMQADLLPGGVVEDTAPLVPKAVVPPPGPEPRVRPPLIPWSETVIYELDVRGFTKLHPDVPEGMRGTWAALGTAPVIEHLTRLGVTTVEVMPSAAWIDERHLPPLGLTNAWGYNPVAFMAPDPRLAPGGWDEIAGATAALAEAGIEVILDVVFNHSGEGDELGPALSLRGLDNATYYRLRPDAPELYVNDAGCGNVLALDRPPVVRLVTDALRTWARRGGLAGFRFDLATTLARRPDGFDPAAPLLAAIEQDPELRGLKLIAEPWDCGPGGYQLGAFPGPWGEWNDRYRDDVRRFWRGDPGRLGALATRLAGSEDAFSAHRRPSRSVNFVAAHDGFTLADLTAYSRKHNWANGEDNRDGSDGEISWSHGAEGPSDDPEVQARRLADQRALLALLLFSRGTPMLTAGSELGQSQGGNNNAYAQDNESRWLDWEGSDSALLAFARRLVELRREHPGLRQDRFLTGEAQDASLLPDVDWRTPDGRAMNPQDWSDPERRSLVIVLHAPGPMGGDRVALAVNRSDDPVPLTLPEPQDGRSWRLRIDSARPELADVDVADGASLAAGTVALFAEAPGRRAVRPASPAALAGLAQAAGVSTEWHDVAGRRQAVSAESLRAVLSAMALPADSSGQAAESLGRLADERFRRPLAYAACNRAGQPLHLMLASESPAEPRTWLTITAEDGAVTRLRVQGAEPAHGRGPDGRRLWRWRLRLPDLPAGRYRVVREDAPEAACAVTVAPPRGFTPEPLRGDARLWGLSAQLYSLRRQGDQGVGDLTTLAELAEAAAAQGAASLGLNPLHALFPERRERASPYYPSDRRFLDPIYLDLDQVPGLAGGYPRDAAAELSALASVDYPRVWELKKAALEAAFRRFEAERGPDDPLLRERDAFLDEGGAALLRFAAFSTIAESRPREPWHAWPPELRDAHGAGVDALVRAQPDRIRFHQHLQWLCERQLAVAARRGRAAGLALGFYRDLAVGAAPDGAEAWADADLLAEGMSVGAPPDPLGPEGQVWGLPPPIPAALARDVYARFARTVASNMRHAGALRIDHVLGLQRLFWVPEGGSPADGTYVAMPFEALTAEIALESVRNRCWVIGEDLGTVPEGLREAMAAQNMAGFRVLYFEQDHGRFRPPAQYTREAVATVSTHDLPTLAGWWAGADIAERRELGLQPGPASDEAGRGREEDKRALGEALAAEGYPRPGAAPAEHIALETAAAIHGFVAAAPSQLMLAQVEDLAGEVTAVNLPGTDQERPNWRRKLAQPVPELLRTELADAILAEIRRRRPPGPAA